MHAEDDARRYLRSIKLPADKINIIITEIFGKERNGERIAGLVDAENGAIFEKKWLEVSENWPKHFTSWTESHKGRMRNFRDMIKTSMLLPVRISAGLGLHVNLLIIII